MVIRILLNILPSLSFATNEIDCDYELPNNLRYRILENYEISEKSQNLTEFLPSAQSYSPNKNFVYTSKTFLRNRN